MTVWVDKQGPPELYCPGPVPIVTLLAQQLSQGLLVWRLGRAQLDTQEPSWDDPGTV